MKRIILSLVLITVTIGAITYGATTAFFSDTETSAGNIFTAGELDLKIDNESYYNLNKCEEITAGVWQWQGEADYPEVGTPCTTSWGLDDLTGHLFFDFTDVKPDDEGEDTISIHVQNDAWACMDLTLTSNDDVSSTEPELGDGDTPEGVSIWDGELAQNLQMFWWADDGDNVYEEGEDTISGGVKDLNTLASTTGAFSIALADSATNVWGEVGPIPDNETVYIAKAWCFGTLTPAPVADVDGEDPGGPQERGTGFSCDGTLLDNKAQTDSATLDIEFRSEQARHNDNFRCTLPEDGTITVTKVLEGEGSVEDFSFVIDGGSPIQFEDDGTNEVPVTAGQHDVVETPEDGYTATYSNSQNDNPNCDDLDVPEGGNVTCTITNTFTPDEGTLVIEKRVVGGQAATSSFSYQIDGGSAIPFESDGSNEEALAPGTYDVEEVSPEGYSVSYTNSQNAELNCDNLNVVDGGQVTCFITNTFAPICEAAIDLMVVMDNSGSINDAEEGIMQAGAVSFLNALTIGPDDSHAGLVSFATAATLDQSLTDNEAAVVAAINDPFSGGNTNLAAGIHVAATELTGNGRPSIPDVMVIITDGNPNVPTNEATAQALAFASSTAAKNAGITIYVIGVGGDVNDAYLTTIASANGYYSADDFADLEIALLTIANCGDVPTTILIQKNVVGGTAQPNQFTFTIDDQPASVGLNIVTPGLHTVEETGGPLNYTATFSGGCNAQGEITATAGTNTTCIVTNTFVPPPPVNLFSSSFGTTSNGNIPDWEESDGTTEVVAAGSGQDTASPDGGAFARLGQTEWMCRAVPAGFTSLVLSYYWRGDVDAEEEDETDDEAFVQYRTSGACNSGGGWTTLTTHQLDDENNNIDEGWQGLVSHNLPANATLVRFITSDNDDDAEAFRVDGITLAGQPL